MAWHPFSSRSGVFSFRIWGLGPRALAVLTLLAGLSLGLFAGRNLWASKPTVGVAPVLDAAIEAKVSLYTEHFRLDTRGADRIRFALQSYDQQVQDLYRSLRQGASKQFDNLQGLLNQDIRAVLDEYRVPEGR